MLALDWCKGLVMVLMTLDHAGMVFNQYRDARNSWYLFPAGGSVEPLALMMRFITHLCAPMFLFIGGVGLAKSYESRLRTGVTEASFTRDLLVRAGVFLAIDFLWWGVKWMQVLSAFAFGYLLLVFLRRLPKTVIGLLAVFFLVASEVALPFLMRWAGGDGSRLWKWLAGPGEHPWWQAPLLLLLHPGRLEIGDALTITVQYPALPWSGMFLLGWACSGWFRRLGSREQVNRHGRWFLGVGLGLLAGFAAVRWGNAFGNMYLLRQDGSWTQWLLLSKYPPSIAFTLSQFGILALLLALLTPLEWRVRQHGRDFSVDFLRVYAAAPLFFYCVHAHLLKLGGYVTGKTKQMGFATEIGSTVVVLFVMYWLCLWYTRLKAAHPRSVLRYL